jgi:hypothetical protein
MGTGRRLNAPVVPETFFLTDVELPDYLMSRRNDKACLRRGGVPLQFARILVQIAARAPSFAGASAPRSLDARVLTTDGC